MAIKKINSILSLLTILCFLAHSGYSAYSYLTLYYNPSLTKLFSIPLMVLVCIHAVLGMLTVFLLSDGTRLDLYPKENIRTIIQRVSAALILPFLFLHIKLYGLLKTAGEEGQMPLFILLIAAQVLFFATVYIHIAVSLSRALITLGVLTSRKMQKGIDRIVYILCVILFLAVIVCVIKGQIAMFLH